ncbi:branched-chain amino acid transport system ATP-binding protein [Tardiphaga sp. OK245]|jgi:branched-chain amino acid transport system ATP-binding protein|nr:branched-chain amino acid transport system ATP-binding protein [Tardiphaga sp. OK245]
MPMRELVLDNVSAGYAGATVLEGVSLSVKQGERVGIVGRNGAGKTTTLGTAMGFAELRGGNLKADGKDLRRLRPFKRARLGIGYVPQTRDIFPTLTVEENLEAGLNGRSRDHLFEAYDLFPRLAERRRNRGRDLSGGEQQMLSVARALMNDVSILLLDEPLEGLAPVVADELMAAIKRLTADRGLGCILIEQHVDTVLDFCDNVLVLERGRSVFWGDVATLRKSPTILNSAIGLHRIE